MVLFLLVALLLIGFVLVVFRAGINQIPDGKRSSSMAVIVQFSDKFLMCFVDQKPIKRVILITVYILKVYIKVVSIYSFGGCMY
jgi:hypothetical protein